jgi:hypothetical protein
MFRIAQNLERAFEIITKLAKVANFDRWMVVNASQSSTEGSAHDLRILPFVPSSAN